MGTVNISLTKVPSKVISANTSFIVSLPWKGDLDVEWATTNTPGTAPTVAVWHPLRASKNDKLNRIIVCNNLEIWMRCLKSSVIIVLDVG